MKEEQLSTQELQLKLAKIQTGLTAGIFALLLIVGIFMMTAVNGVMKQIDALDLDKINATVASLQETAAQLEKIDMEVINQTVDSLKGAAENLSQTDIGAINDGIRALSTAAENLQGLDVDQLNELIKSLETVSAQMEKTTSAFSKLFGR